MFIFARLVAIILLVAVALPAAAAEPVRVDIGHHPGFTRLIFGWTGQVGYTIIRKGRSARINFEKPGEIDTGRMATMLPTPAFGMPIASQAAGDLVLDLTIPETAYLRHFSTDSNIVVDILELSKVDNLEGGENFGGVVASGSDSGPVMRTLSPSGEIVVIPAMVGTTVAVAPQGVPLITEEDAAGSPGGGVAARPRTGYDPLTHYDPTASGQPRTLLLYERKAGTNMPSGG